MRTLSAIAGVLALLIAAAVVTQLVVQARTGPLPLVSVLELQLLVAAAVMAVVGLAGSLAGPGRQGAGRRSGRVTGLVQLGLLAVIVLAVVRAGGQLWSPSPAVASDDQELVVLSWNLELGSKAAVMAVDGIAAVDADLVALQELTPDVAAMLESDARIRARYPYRVLEPGEGVDGMGLLAKRPLLVRGSERDPLILRAGLLLEHGTIVDVLDVHPYPPRVGRAGPLPIGLDTRARDDALGSIAGRLETLDDPTLALVVGDLNTTSTEPGMAPLGSSLTDAHAVAGTGPGFSWRPSSLEALGVGILRIDHVLSGSRIQPVASSVDCSLPGDHCRLVVRLRVRVVDPQPVGGS